MRKPDDEKAFRKAKGGRPPKINEELIQKVCSYLRHGAYVETAAAASGVSKDILYKWMRAGKEKPNSIYGEFLSAVELAIAEGEIHDLAAISKARSRNWQASAWRLQRRHPERWGDSSNRPQAPQQNPDAEPLIKSPTTFEEFCANAGYPSPYPLQLSMREFVFDDDGKTSRLLLGSRGYGKTDYTTILGSAFKIYRDRQYRILIITKSDEKNASIIDEIVKALTYNGVALEKDNAHFLRTKGLHGKDHSVSALTVGSTSLRGRHPDLIIMDDPVTEEDVSEATRAKLQRKYNELVKLCPNIAIIGQPVHVFDLYETLRPIVRVMEVPHGMIPELDHDLVAMKLAGVSEISINASYHLKVTSETGNPLSGVSWIDSFPTGESVAFIDPSFRGGDYTAMSVGKGHFDGVAIQGFAWKKAWADCLPDMIAACKAHSIKRLCFETNALGMQPLSVLRAAFADAGVAVGVTGRDSTGYKHSRIMAAGTFAKLIHLAKTSHRIYIDQVTKYEYGSKFDDAPDSLASLLEWLGLIRGKK